MTEPQETTSVPDLTLDHRLTGTAIPEAGNVTPDSTAPEIGDKMEDGTIYAGVSPDTGKAMYVMPKDAPGTLKWKAAMKYAARLDANGHKDWKLPTKAELNVLFENRAKIGGFNESGSYNAGYYWSSTKGPPILCEAWQQRFCDNGGQISFFKSSNSSVRPVRSEFRP